MARVIKLSRGLDINLAGKAEKSKMTLKASGKYALCPASFEGVKPKVMVKEGDKVKAGDEIGVTITGSGFVSFKYKMFINDRKDILQEGELGDKEGTYTVKVAGTDFKGPVVFYVYGVRDGRDEILDGCDFVIE